MKRKVIFILLAMALLPIIVSVFAQESVKEQVKCIFTDSNSEQKCYTGDWKFSCSGIGSCLINVEGEKDKQLVWKSSCPDAASTFTFIDGKNKEIAFKCAPIPKEPLPAENRTTTPIIQCTDSDGGKNYDLKGITKDQYGEKTDYCQNEKQITEYYCQDDGTGKLTMWTIGAVDCQYGCKDGACLPKPNPVCGNGICESEDEKTSCAQDCKSLIKCYQDSDCGQPSISKYCGSRMPQQKYYFDGSYACKSDNKYACQNPGTYESVCTGSIGESCSPCSNGCKEGECIGVSPPQQTCADSDGGINYYAAGCVEMLNDLSFGINGKKCDFCMGANKYLQEYVCENGIYKGDHTYQCPDSCLNGACTKGEQVKEQVKCIFENSNSEQRCYGSGEKYSCPGKDSCIIDIVGNKGEQVVWKSTCGGYAYTTIDGNNEEARFNCQITPPTNETIILPNGFKNAYWQCQDGKETKQGDETSCKPSESWKNYAEETCKYNCKVYDQDHKKCAISLNKEMPVTKLSVKGTEYTIELISASEDSVNLKIAGSESAIKEFAEGARVTFFDLTFVINSAAPSKADIVVEGEDNVSCMKCGLNSFSVYNECSLENIVKPSVCGNGICESGEWQICKLTATTCKEGETCKASTADCYIPCPQDCPKGKEGIYAKLNEKFKLQMSQEAKFTDYQNLVIKFNELFVPKCNPTLGIQESAAETEKTSTIEKYPITGKASLSSTFMTQPSEAAMSPEKCIEGESLMLSCNLKHMG